MTDTVINLRFDGLKPGRYLLKTLPLELQSGESIGAAIERGLQNGTVRYMPHDDPSRSDVALCAEEREDDL